MISRSDVEAARTRIGTRVRTTPVLRTGLRGRDLWLKLEQFQHTGSFKARGAFNRVLSAMERAAKVVNKGLSKKMVGRTCTTGRPDQLSTCSDSQCSR